MRTRVEVGNDIKHVVTAMNSLSIEELDEVLLDISGDEGLGPLLDPTLWGHGGMFEASRQTRKVIRAIRVFKVEVSGIGNFSRIT